MARRLSARRFVDLAAIGVFVQARTENWELTKGITNLSATSPTLLTHVYRELKDGPTTPGLMMLARAIAGSPDEDGLLLLVRFEKELKLGFVGAGAIERVITKTVAVEDWLGAYNVVPIPAGSLRQRLLALATDGGAQDAAARCLRLIDQHRDEYGTPEAEPRHPDLFSGKCWQSCRVGVDGADAG